jgi:outer membrane protein TolC
LTGSLSAGESFTDNIETDETIGFALRHNPAVLLAEGARLNAKRELSTARWQLLPSVSLSGGWSTSYYNYSGAPVAPYMDMLKRNGGEYLSMSMSIPIFNRLSRRTDIARKRNALATAEAQYDQALRDVESEVRRAIQDRDGAARACTQAQYKAELQEEAYNLNLKKLEQGLISPLEFQTANNNYLRAKADEMNSLFQYLIKQAVVRYYNGEEYINQ